MATMNTEQPPFTKITVRPYTKCSLTWALITWCIMSVTHEEWQNTLKGNLWQPEGSEPGIDFEISGQEI
jgi:hypothetical protein